MKEQNYTHLQASGKLLGMKDVTQLGWSICCKCFIAAHTHTQISQPVVLVSDSMQQQGELMGIIPKHGIHEWTQEMSWWLKAHHSFSV